MEINKEELEYNIEVNGQSYYWSWCDEDTMLRVWDSPNFVAAKKELPDGWKFIKRVKAGEIQYV